jgi:DNA-directed RNA polymerase specialized sigma24 family protein
MADWETAFGELLQARSGALRSYAYLLTGETAAAGDLVQDASRGSSTPAVRGRSS